MGFLSDILVFILIFAPFIVLAYRISAEKKEGVVFLFYWDGSFIPPMRSWFIYCSDEFLAKKGTDFRCESPYCERINKNWFREELR